MWAARCSSCSACVLGDRAPEPEQELPESYWAPFRQSAAVHWNRRPGSMAESPPNICAALAQPEGGGASVEQVAQIVYENAMLATAPDHAKPHWPSWADLPNTDARIHALNTADILLARWGHPAAPPAPEPGEVGELVAWLHGQDGGREKRAIHSRIATLLQQQQHLLGLACQELDNFMEQQQTAPAPVVVPVPVTERLPQAGEVKA